MSNEATEKLNQMRNNVARAFMAHLIEAYETVGTDVVWGAVSALYDIISDPDNQMALTCSGQERVEMLERVEQIRTLLRGEVLMATHEVRQRAAQRPQENVPEVKGETWKNRN